MSSHRIPVIDISAPESGPAPIKNDYSFLASSPDVFLGRSNSVSDDGHDGRRHSAATLTSAISHAPTVEAPHSLGLDYIGTRFSTADADDGHSSEEDEDVLLTRNATVKTVGSVYSTRSSVCSIASSNTIRPNKFGSSASTSPDMSTTSSLRTVRPLVPSPRPEVQTARLPTPVPAPVYEPIPMTTSVETAAELLSQRSSFARLGRHERNLSSSSTASSTSTIVTPVVPENEDKRGSWYDDFSQFIKSEPKVVSSPSGSDKPLPTIPKPLILSAAATAPFPRSSTPNGTPITAAFFPNNSSPRLPTFEFEYSRFPGHERTYSNASLPEMPVRRQATTPSPRVPPRPVHARSHSLFATSALDSQPSQQPSARELGYRPPAMSYPSSPARVQFATAPNHTRTFSNAGPGPLSPGYFPWQSFAPSPLNPSFRSMPSSPEPARTSFRALSTMPEPYLDSPDFGTTTFDFARSPARSPAHSRAGSVSHSPPETSHGHAQSRPGSSMGHYHSRSASRVGSYYDPRSTVYSDSKPLLSRSSTTLLGSDDLEKHSTYSKTRIDHRTGFETTRTVVGYKPGKWLRYAKLLCVVLAMVLVALCIYGGVQVAKKKKEDASS